LLARAVGLGRGISQVASSGLNTVSDLAAGRQAQNDAAKQAAQSANISTAASIAILIASIWSDSRLKENIKYEGTIEGQHWYSWDWNEEAKQIGADEQPSFGVIADELTITAPELVSEDESGYLQVDYKGILPDHG
jgi:hypothetical protein